jgi:hypothetical protein
MRNRLSVLFTGVGLAWLTACGGSGGSGSTAPTFEFENLAIPQQVAAGESVEILCIERDRDGPDGAATSILIADIDGDLTTAGDRIPITPEHACDYGAHQSHIWDTANVPTGVYNVVAVLKDDKFLVETTAAGKVTVFHLDITKPAVNRAALSGATIDIAFLYDDPDSTPSIDVLADRDGDVGTDFDQYVIAENLVAKAGGQTVKWELVDVDPGTYSIILAVDDGAQGTEQFTAPGQITVVTMTAIAPQDGTDLLSTAYNARISFSESLNNFGAMLDSGTIRVTNDGAIVPGTYTLENDGREVNFEPSEGVFPASSDIRLEVWTDMLYSDQGAVMSAFAEFTTGLSMVFVTTRASNHIAFVSMEDPTKPVVGDILALNEEGGDDQPYASVCASDGILYLSQYLGDPEGYVIVYDVINRVRAGTIPLPALFGENATGAAGLVLSPDEKTLYCAGWEQDPGAEWWHNFERRPFLSIIDRASMKETRRIQLNFSGSPRGIAVSPDGTRVYVANPFAGDYAAVMSAGGEVPSHLADPVFGMIHVVSTLTNEELDTDGVAGNGISPIIPDADFVSGVAVSADGGTLYASHSGMEFLHYLRLPFTPNISTFNTTTFVEGMPLFSLAGDEYTAGVHNLLFDPTRDLLYAPRSNIGGLDRMDALSVFQPYVPREAVVDTSVVPANNEKMRDIDILWGTSFLVMADANMGLVVADVNLSKAIGYTPVEIGAKDVATIPPRRH